MAFISETKAKLMREPVKVRVAFAIIITFFVAIITFFLVAVIVDLGILGALIFVGVGAAAIAMLWAVITVAGSGL